MDSAGIAVVFTLLRSLASQRLIALPAAALLLAGCLAGCAGHSGSQGTAALTRAADGGPSRAAEPPAPGVFPPPSSLLKSPQALGDPVRFREGSDVHDDIYNRISGEIVDGKELLRLDPEFSGGAGDLDGLAYAVFELFNLEGYAGSQRLRIDWHSAPLDPDDLWVAFSDFPQDRWVWRRAAAPGAEMLLPQVPGWLGDEGQLLVLVALTGSEPAVLNWMLYGDNHYQPYFSLSTSEGTAPLDVDFDIEGSFIAGSTESSFDFDFEGDGTFDLFDIQNLQFSHHYNIPGSYSPTLRVVDEDLNFGEYSRDLLVINPNNDPPLADLEVNVSSGDAPLLISLDGSGSSDPDGTLVKFEWDFDGDNIWERETPGPTLNASLGKAGANNIRLRVTDNDTATAIASVTVTLDRGWHYVTVDGDITSNPAPSCSFVGTSLDSQLGVAYFSGETSEIRFARAINDECSDWGDPVNVQVSEAFHAFPSLRNVDERPAIAYQGSTPQGGTTLSFVRATSANGATWGSPLTIDPAVPSQPALGFAGGIPVILAGERGQDGLMFANAQNAQGSSWNPLEAVLSAPPLHDMTDLALNSAEGNPAAVYLLRHTEEETFSLHFIRALDAQGADWDSPQPLTASHGDTACLAVIDGNPALAYVSPEPERDVMFLRASSADGSSWGEPVLVSDYGLPAGQVDLHSVGGIANICWFDDGDDGPRLRFVSAENQEGTSWGVSMPVSQCGNYGGSFDLASSAGMPVVVHAFGSNPVATILRASTLY